jgi:diguanylate cyclase (GGDEF)-like protein
MHLRHSPRGRDGQASPSADDTAFEQARAGVEAMSRLVALGTAEELAEALPPLIADLLDAPAAVFLGDNEDGLRAAVCPPDPHEERLRLAEAAASSARLTTTLVQPNGNGLAEALQLTAVPMSTAAQTFGAIVIDGTAEPAQLELLSSVAALAAALIEQRERAETTAAEARLDPLTGLANKRAFHERLETLLPSATADAPLSVVLFDVDNFKRINDREGHLIGDRVLRQVARVSLSALRTGEDLFRLGGEEFAVLVHADKRNAERVANRIRNGLAAQRRHDPLPTVSAGVAMAPADGELAEQLLHKADVALYAAKEQGKDRVVAYAPDASDAAASDRELREQHLEAEWWMKVLGANARGRPDDDLGPGWLPQDIAHLCDLVAIELAIPDEDREAIVLAAVLTELCKLTLPDSIRRKAARLTPREWKLVRGRTERLVGALAPIPHLAEAMPILTSFRERWDGRGYPGQLRGDTIPIGARIVALCETFCALTQPRSYRPARTQARALLELQELSGRRFDPACVQALQNVAERGALLRATLATVAA